MLATDQQTEREWMASDQAVEAHRDRVDAAAKMVTAGIAAAYGKGTGNRE